MAEILTSYQHTPLGWLEITGTEAGICTVSFLDEEPGANLPDVPEALRTCHNQLTEYFKGERKNFSLKLAPNGTDFQQKVWQHLSKIPFGKTASYLEIAHKLGEPTYTRAVGSANGKNPLAIIVPCHRVIGANGSLTGYAGGLWRKKWLLEFENPSPQGSLF